MTPRAVRPVRRTTGGFTLTELMVSVVISGIVSISILGLQSQLANLFRAQNKLSEAQQTGRAAADAVGRDLRMAGFMLTDGLTVALTTEGSVPRAFPQLFVRNGDTASDFADTVVVAFADTSALTTVTGGLSSASSTPVASVAGFAPGDLIVASNQNIGCIMKVTSVTGSSLDHGTAGGPWNSSTNAQCDALAGVWGDGTTQIAKLTLRGYRVRPGDPRGVLEVSPSGTVVANDWQEVAQGVLDLQVAIQVREPGDTADLDGDGDPTLDWYSGSAMSTAMDSPPLPAPQKAPMSARISLVARGGTEQPTSETLTPQLCVTSRPNNNDLGDHCSFAISTITSNASRYYHASAMRKSTIVVDLRNLGTGVGTP